MKKCLLFSGQSIQAKGMGNYLWKNADAKALLDRLRGEMGIDLEFLTTRMEEDELQKTYNTQRAIHAHHLGNWFAYRVAHPETEIGAVAGHSMGIVAALVVAESLTVEDSARLIFRRAKIFSETCQQLGEDWGLLSAQTENLQDLIDELPQVPGVELALHNAPSKGVLGGKIENLEKLQALAKAEEWPVRFRLLKVEGPYHTKAFQICEASWREAIKEIPIAAPRLDVFMGTSGKLETDPERIRELLAQQPFVTEQYCQSVQQAVIAGYREFIEVAHAPQVIHLVKEIAGETEVTTTSVPTSEIGFRPSFRKAG